MLDRLPNELILKIVSIILKRDIDPEQCCTMCDTIPQLIRLASTCKALQFLMRCSYLVHIPLEYGNRFISLCLLPRVRRHYRDSLCIKTMRHGPSFTVFPSNSGGERPELMDYQYYDMDHLVGHKCSLRTCSNRIDYFFDGVYVGANQVKPWSAYARMMTRVNQRIHPSYLHGSTFPVTIKLPPRLNIPSDSLIE